MQETFWQKIKRNHLLLMTLYCGVPIALIIGFLILFKSGSDWTWLLILLCPLMHIFMMRGHKHDLGVGEYKLNVVNNQFYQCPECGLEYKEKEWAEKCEMWCKKYKSCNLEITKHAIKEQ